MINQNIYSHSHQSFHIKFRSEWSHAHLPLSLGCSLVLVLLCDLTFNVLGLPWQILWSGPGDQVLWRQLQELLQHLLPGPRPVLRLRREQCHGSLRWRQGGHGQVLPQQQLLRRNEPVPSPAAKNVRPGLLGFRLVRRDHQRRGLCSLWMLLRCWSRLLINKTLWPKPILKDKPLVNFLHSDCWWLTIVFKWLVNGSLCFSWSILKESFQLKN